MTHEVSLLCSADENYSRHCAVTLLSVFSNTRFPEKIHLHLLSPDLSDVSVDRLKSLCKAFEAKITFFEIDLKLFKNLPIKHKHFSLSTYSRLIAPELCSQCDRLLYIDCDLIVLGDIIELFVWDIKDKLLGAVPHVSLPYQQTFIANFPVAGEDDYFNAGVMLLNAELWRKKKVVEAILTIANSYSDKLEFADQDPLNMFFWKNYTHISGIWNVEARLYKEKILGVRQCSETEYRMNNPQIIHYTGSQKPWNSSQYVPKRDLYKCYSERLANEFDWPPSKVEVKRCRSRNYLQFMISIIYFRIATLKRDLTMKK